ncbi:TetR/AcrR family transcriptional regulator [Larkinella bovis]|uniref:TetR/AcrR family transcriptional regulator n=1 Tax=Larkinella bovis TaxID=683041 RepID=A0ABW0IG57_9BACT
MTKGEETRQFIVERSAPIFNTKGIAATAMSDIMAATKLSKGSLYVHFENKEDLAAVVVDYNMQLLAEKVLDTVNSHTNAKDRLFAYFDFFLDSQHSPVVGGCPMMNFGTEADDTNELIRAKVNDVINSSQGIIRDIIEQGIRDGVFKADWNYKEFATVAFAMLEGGILIIRVAGHNAKMKIINKTLKEMVMQQLT